MITCYCFYLKMFYEVLLHKLFWILNQPLSKTVAFKDLELVKYCVTLFLLPVQDILICFLLGSVDLYLHTCMKLFN